jgi:Flp pilus assembly protein TadG
MKMLHNYLHRLKEDTGQTLIEFILVLPFIFLLILNAVNFGGLFYAWITVANASRAGANYAILGDASAGNVSAPTGTQVDNMIKAEIASLSNSSSLIVNVCQKNNTVTSVLFGTCTGIPSDVEPSNFVLTSVDVTYTYKPIISGFQFPKLGVYLTLVPTTVHMITQMRTIQ